MTSLLVEKYRTLRLPSLLYELALIDLVQKTDWFLRTCERCYKKTREWYLYKEETLCISCAMSYVKGLDRVHDQLAREVDRLAILEATSQQQVWWIVVRKHNTVSCHYLELFEFMFTNSVKLSSKLEKTLKLAYTRYRTRKLENQIK